MQNFLKVAFFCKDRHLQLNQTPRTHIHQTVCSQVILMPMQNEMDHCHTVSLHRQNNLSLGKYCSQSWERTDQLKSGSSYQKIDPYSIFPNGAMPWQQDLYPKDTSPLHMSDCCLEWVDHWGSHVLYISHQHDVISFDCNCPFFVLFKKWMMN